MGVLGDFERRREHFPRQLTTALIVAAVGLIGGGLLVWRPAAGGPSTAYSDLGLALLGGGIALIAGFVVARVVFDAQQRLDERQQRSEQSRERESLKFALSISDGLRGADLHDRDLQGLYLVRKDLREADLRGADLKGATLAELSLGDAVLRGANLMGVTLGRENGLVSLHRADLRNADLRHATFRADARGADMRRTDLRGTDLSRALLVHPHPEQASEEDVRLEATALEGAQYDQHTKWPEGFDPEAAGGVFREDD